MSSADDPRTKVDVPDLLAATEILDDQIAPVEICNAMGRGNAVLVCDHASNRVPHHLGMLGLSAADLDSHIAWDPGAAEVAHHLSELLDAPLVLSGYSRLLIDCNRPLQSVESIPTHSHGVAIPGNQALTEDDRARRVAALFHPYHAAIRETLDSRAGQPSLLLSIHSFTAMLEGRQRPWSVGLTYGRDDRLAALMLEALKREGDIVVGDNQPYALEAESDYTIPVHGEARGLPHVLIETRQDIIRTAQHASQWAWRLAEIFRQIEPAATRFC